MSHDHKLKFVLAVSEVSGVMGCRCSPAWDYLHWVPVGHEVPPSAEVCQGISFNRGHNCLDGGSLGCCCCCWHLLSSGNLLRLLREDARWLKPFKRAPLAQSCFHQLSWQSSFFIGTFSTFRMYIRCPFTRRSTPFSAHLQSRLSVQPHNTRFISPSIRFMRYGSLCRAPS